MRKGILVITLFIITTSSLFSQEKAKRIDSIMSTWHQYNMFDGAVLVAENRKMIYEKGFGLANREWNIPNTHLEERAMR